MVQILLYTQVFQSQKLCKVLLYRFLKLFVHIIRANNAHNLPQTLVVRLCFVCFFELQNKRHINSLKLLAYHLFFVLLCVFVVKNITTKALSAQGFLIFIISLWFSVALWWVIFFHKGTKGHRVYKLPFKILFNPSITLTELKFISNPNFKSFNFK